VGLNGDKNMGYCIKCKEHGVKKRFKTLHGLEDHLVEEHGKTKWQPLKESRT